jgi:hypothetical protein
MKARKKRWTVDLDNRPGRVGDQKRMIYQGGWSIACVDTTPAAECDIDPEEVINMMAAAPELLAAVEELLPLVTRLAAYEGHVQGACSGDIVAAMHNAQVIIDRIRRPEAVA